MKLISRLILILLVVVTSCTSQKKLSYLNNLPSTTEPQFFQHSVPLYKLQYRDLLYIEIKTLSSDGKIENLLQSSSMGQYVQGEGSQLIIGHNINKDGTILLPVIGKVNLGGLTIPEANMVLQEKVDSVFNHAYVDVKLLNFRFTVLGEVRTPGTFVNYNDYLTVLEAIGRAGGIGDYGRRDKILIVRSTTDGSKTFRIDLQDKNLITSEAYFLMPNDVIIIEPERHKIFNLNLPSISFGISALTSVITTTLLLINYFGK